MARGITVTDRAQRLRALAEQAEIIARLALAAERTLASARAELLGVASAAHKLTAKLEAESEARYAKRTNGGAS